MARQGVDAMENVRRSFLPDYAVHPGRHIEEWLEESGMTQAEFARRIGMSAKALNQMVKGHAPVTPETSLKLEAVTGVPARLWNNMQALYAADCARISRTVKMKEEVSILATLPLAHLRRAGHVTAPAADKVSTLEQVLRFFAVSDVDAWHANWTAPAAAFRASAAFAAQPGAVATWLRLGELAASEIEVARLDKRALLAAVPQMRRLSLVGDLPQFLPTLQGLCARAGIAVVVVEAVDGIRCAGATHWPLNKPVIQLSLRHRTDDHFWFTFFHELAHVLRHGRGNVFIDDGEAADQREEEADQFARDMLIPAAHADELPNLRSLVDITAFALRIGVSPGIVVGRLQHDRHIPHSVGNRLKRRI